MRKFTIHIVTGIAQVCFLIGYQLCEGKIFYNRKSHQFLSESKQSKSRRKQLSLFIDLKTPVTFHIFNELRAFDLHIGSIRKQIEEQP